MWWKVVDVAEVVEVSKWVGAGVGIVGSAYMLTVLFWRPERNVDRARLGHWFRSLIRLYESDSRVDVLHRGSPMRFALLRRADAGSGCWVVVSFPRANWLSPRLAPVREAIAAEPGVLILPDTRGDERERLDVQFKVPDIWSSDAAARAVRISGWVLDALEVPDDACFDLEFAGEQSMERSLEARRRQREGSLPEW